MARFLDGPAAGRSLLLRTCPMFLRVVIDAKTGKLDALDQASDEPRWAEDVHAYRSVPGTWSQAFVRPGGRYEIADYRVMPVQPDEATLRIRHRWLAWCRGVLSEEEWRNEAMGER